MTDDVKLTVEMLDEFESRIAWRDESDVYRVSINARELGLLIAAARKGLEWDDALRPVAKILTDHLQTLPNIGSPSGSAETPSVGSTLPPGPLSKCEPIGTDLAMRAKARGMVPGQPQTDHDLYFELAALIERQAAEIVRLRTDLSESGIEKARQEWNEAQAEIARQAAEIATMKVKDWDLENDALSRRLDEAQAEIARLREALEEIQGHCEYNSVIHETARAALASSEEEDART